MASPYVFDATRENFDRLVVENSRRGPVLVHFWTPRAGPCLILMPRLVNLADEYGGRFLLAMLNVDEHGSIARGLGINSVPTVKVFRDGQVVDTVHGAEPEATFRALLDRFIAGEDDRIRAEAHAAFARGETDRARELIAQAALDSPDDAGVAADVMRILLGSGKARDAVTLYRAMPLSVRNSPEVAVPASHALFIATALDAPDPDTAAADSAAHPDDDTLRFRLAASRLVNDDVEGALDALIEVVRRNPGFDDGAARRGVLAIFATLGAEHELTHRYRAMLAQALGH